MDAETLERLETLIGLALAEDLGEAGDVTSRATIPASLPGRAAVVVRAAGVIAGLDASRRVFARVDPTLAFTTHVVDGTAVAAGAVVAEVAGSMRSILTAERTALNFLQRLSGIATRTRRFVDAVAGLPVKLLDTRKTTPGWRLLEKYAVRMGGGTNHRVGLFDLVLVKDNHLAANDGRVAETIAAARAASPSLHLEVEVDSASQLDAALATRPDFVLLDNMNLDDLRRAVSKRNAMAPGVLLEASGGVTLQTVRAIAETGVDRISVGGLTHSAPALDMALDWCAVR